MNTFAYLDLFNCRLTKSVLYGSLSFMIMSSIWTRWMRQQGAWHTTIRCSHEFHLEFKLWLGSIVVCVSAHVHTGWSGHPCHTGLIFTFSDLITWLQYYWCDSPGIICHDYYSNIFRVSWKFRLLTIFNITYCQFQQDSLIIWVKAISFQQDLLFIWVKAISFFE